MIHSVRFLRKWLKEKINGENSFDKTWNNRGESRKKILWEYGPSSGK
jgi:hypothetical protein